MNAIKRVRRYIEAQPDTPAARALSELARALADEREYPLSSLYEIELEAFELGMDLMRDWRLDRFYSQRLRLLEVVPGDLLPDGVAEDLPSAAAAGSGSDRVLEHA